MNFKKEFLFLIVLTIIIIILAVVLLWPTNKNNAPQTTNNVQNNQTIKQKTEGIQVDSPKVNDQITSPLKITGSVNGGGWSAFEGQVGTVQLLDVKGNKIAEGILKATTEWTASPVQFESTITFQSKVKGAATLLFSNENPSGSPDKDKKFGLPVVIK